MAPGSSRSEAVPYVAGVPRPRWLRPRIDFGSPPAGTGPGAGPDRARDPGRPARSLGSTPAFVVPTTAGVVWARGDPALKGSGSAPGAPRPERAPTLIPYLFGGHRATGGSNGEICWEPAVPPTRLIPLVEPNDASGGIERRYRVGLRSSTEEQPRFRGPSGGFPTLPGGGKLESISCPKWVRAGLRWARRDAQAASSPCSLPGVDPR